MLESTLFQINADYVDPENRKILGVSAKTKVLSFETISGAVKVNLLTTFRLLFRSEDGVFSHETVETEQTETIQNRAIAPTTFVCVNASVTETNRMGTKLQATVEVSGWLIEENTVTVLNACTPGLHCKTAPFKAENVTGLYPGGLSLTFTDESRMNVSALIECCSEATVSNVFVSSGSYRIEGDIYIRVFCQGEDGQCFTQLFTHSYSTEVSDDKVDPSSEIDIDVTVKNSELSLADGDKRLLISDVTLSFCGCAAKTVEAETVVDAYSETNEIALKAQDVTVTEGFCTSRIREKISDKISFKNGINELFGVLCPTVSASYVNNNGTVSVEGIIYTGILFLTGKDEAESVTSETTFKFSLPLDYICENKMQPSVCITGVSARSRGSEVDLLIEVILSVKGVTSKTVRVVSEIETGQAKEENDFAVSLYIVRKGETLWDVAKALNTSEDVLLTQNTDVPLPLSGGEKVILFRELSAEK